METKLNGFNRISSTLTQKLNDYFTTCSCNPGQDMPKTYTPGENFYTCIPPGRSAGEKVFCSSNYYCDTDIGIIYKRGNPLLCKKALQKFVNGVFSMI